MKRRDVLKAIVGTAIIPFVPVPVLAKPQALGIPGAWGYVIETTAKGITLRTKGMDLTISDDKVTLWRDGKLVYDGWIGLDALTMVEIQGTCDYRPTMTVCHYDDWVSMRGMTCRFTDDGAIAEFDKANDISLELI